MGKIQQFFYRLAMRLHPYQSLPLPHELEFVDRGFSAFVAEGMRRDAHFSEYFNSENGVFEVLGMAHVERALRAWRPRELFLMLVLRMAFDIVQEQCRLGVLVEAHNRDRLIEILKLYYQYLRVGKGTSEARAAVDNYIAKHTLPDAISATEAAIPVVIRHSLLAELRRIDTELRDRIPSADSWDNGLQALGLGLQGLDEMVRNEGRYDHCTPINCRVFASTGGDGTHFSLMIQNGEISQDSPVVMTVPCNSGESLIVGENLHDFLCLGLRLGYFGLDNFSLKIDVALDSYTDPDWQPRTEYDAIDVSEHHQRMLDYLGTRLNLQPWTDRQRFERLQERYKSELRLPPDMVMFD